MLSTIFSAIGMPLISAILDKFLEAFKAYENKVISIEQLKDQLYGIMINAIRDIEVAQADALKSTYASFMATMAQSKTVQHVWSFVVISQSIMILWFQLGIPLVVLIVRIWAPEFKFPGSGSTADWSYLLVAACLGMAPVVLKSGPGVGSLTDKFKSLVGK